MGSTTARPIFENQDTHLTTVESAYHIIRIREKDRSANCYVCEDRFESRFDSRTTASAFLPIAMHPKIVAKSNGPGGWAALIYNSTADPIKRNTAMIAVGYSEFSFYLEMRDEKRGTPASRYLPVKIFAGSGVVIISERAKLASLIPRHDQLSRFGSNNFA